MIETLGPYIVAGSALGFVIGLAMMTVAPGEKKDTGLAVIAVLMIAGAALGAGLGLQNQHDHAHSTGSADEHDHEARGRASATGTDVGRTGR